MMGKIVGGILAVLVIVMAVLLGVFYFNLDKVIIAAVEEYGSDVTQSDVTLAEVDLDLTSGKGTLRGLKVGNPEGFEEPSAFELGEISLNVNIADTNDDLIHITEISVDGPQITYELNSNTNNLDALKANIDAFMKANMSSDDKSSEADSDDEGPKLIIDKLTISNGKVTVKAPITMNQKIEGNLPLIQLKDIGKKEGGATPEEVAAQIVDSVTSGAMAVVSGLGVGKTLESLGAGVAGAAESLTKGMTDSGVTKDAGKAVEGAAGAVKGLFK
ncbi:MAG: hypothetical protein V7727_16760 [Sneathiella sp.]